MKHPKFTRRQRDARMAGPVFRDVHPEREVVALYDPDGNASIVTDLPSVMMKPLRQLARRSGVCPAELLVSIFQEAVDKRRRGLRPPASGR